MAEKEKKMNGEPRKVIQSKNDLIQQDASLL